MIECGVSDLDKITEHVHTTKVHNPKGNQSSVPLYHIRNPSTAKLHMKRRGDLDKIPLPKSAPPIYHIRIAILFRFVKLHMLFLFLIIISHPAKEPVCLSP